MAMVVINLVTPKVGAKNELLFNKLASVQDLLIKSSCLASALMSEILFRSHLVVLLKSDLNAQQTHLCGRFVEHLSLT